MNEKKDMAGFAAALGPRMLDSITGGRGERPILVGIARGRAHLADAQLLPPHRLAHFLAQIAHESAWFRTTTEYASGAAYEGRADLGNIHPGDGTRFRGRGLIQVTGRENYGAFAEWLADQRGGAAPDIIRDPALVAAFPWALMSAVWYWRSRDLSEFADANDIEMITRRINGGLNGFEDRCALYTRAALVLLGRSALDVVGFQKQAGLRVDGISGPRTRAALHARLLTLSPANEAEAAGEPGPETAPLPPVKPVPGLPPGMAEALAAMIRRIVREELDDAL